MKNLIVGTQGVRGGSVKRYKVGYTVIETGSDKIISIDNFKGSADDYKQRDEPIICIFNDNQNDCIFEGTHAQLIEKLTKK